MRVLVTGGAGYIGSVVTEALLARGHTVVVYDSLVRGHRDAVPDGVPLVLADVLDAATLGGELREHRIEGVVHLAGLSLVAESMSDPARYYGANVVGGLTLLDAMRAAGVGCSCSPRAPPSTASRASSRSTRTTRPRRPTRTGRRSWLSSARSPGTAGPSGCAA